MFQKMKAVLQKGKNVVLGACAAVAGALVSTPAHAAELIDYAALGTTIMTSIGLAIAAAITVGGAVLVAKMGWKFFKQFTH